jgi:hypothetical protein
MDELVRDRARQLMAVSERVGTLERQNDELARQNTRLRRYVVLQTVMILLCLGMQFHAHWQTGRPTGNGAAAVTPATDAHARDLAAPASGAAGQPVMPATASDHGSTYVR